MDLGAQRIGGEVLFPQAWSEFGDAAGGMLADPLQHIDEVGVRIDAVEPARDDQALDDADVLRAEFCPAEEPGFSAHRYDAQRSLQVVRVNRNIGICEEEFESDTSLAHIVERLDKGVSRCEALALKLPINPLEEQLDQRFAVRQPTGARRTSRPRIPPAA